MSAANPTLNRIAIIAHPLIPEAQAEAERIAAFLRSLGINSQSGLLVDEAIRQEILSGVFDLVIALGGDGTMLRSGHLCGPSGTPLLGINLGRFGFLSEVGKGEWREMLPRLLDGHYRLERRMMLTAEQWRDQQRLGTWEVLNEVVVTRGSMVRPVHLSASADGHFLADYVADALIAATPTGSTAYALAAGGPILPPEIRNILLVAAAPHLSLDRAIVLPEGASVCITVYTDHQAVLCVDGQAPVSMQTGDRVEAFASEHTVQFVRFQDPGYFYRNLTLHMSQNPSSGRNHR
jgi:NAD+ kinase